MPSLKYTKETRAFVIALRETGLACAHIARLLSIKEGTVSLMVYGQAPKLGKNVADDRFVEVAQRTLVTARRDGAKAMADAFRRAAEEMDKLAADVLTAYKEPHTKS
jgi:orotate phosphoribosyltransferase-like protein